MSKAGRITAFFASLLTAASIVQPITVAAENNYKDYDIKPFTLSEKELTELEFEDTDITFSIPSAWEEDEEYGCFYPGEEDENVAFYYFESENPKKFEPKEDIDNLIEYFQKEEPKQLKTKLSAISTNYYKVGDQYIAKTAYTVSATDEDGKNIRWKEVNYIIPVNKEYIMNINVMLDPGKKQTYQKEEEAVILTIVDNNKILFDKYIRSQSTQTRTAAVGTTKVSPTPTPTPKPTPTPTPKPTPTPTPEPVQASAPTRSTANDDCGWVNDSSFPDGGYCSYHPEWYGITAAVNQTQTNTETYYQEPSGNGSNFQTYNDPYTGPAPYIGNANSMVFHHSGCSSVAKMADHNKVPFYSRDDAVNSGYRPCQRCYP